MSVNLFALAVEKINARGQGSVTLRGADGRVIEVNHLCVAPGKPGIARAQTAKFTGGGWFMYFAITDLLSFNVREEVKDEPEENRD